MGLFYRSDANPKALLSYDPSLVKATILKNLDTWVYARLRVTCMSLSLDHLLYTFMVIFNKQGSIIQTDIVKYRETIGGEIQNKSWIDQFISLNNKSNFSPGGDIDGISGATISVNAVRKGVQKLTLLAEYILRKYE